MTEFAPCRVAPLLPKYRGEAKVGGVLVAEAELGAYLATE
jgi:hypothetical protein